jgi:ABC-2 type transport system permease protein
MTTGTPTAPARTGPAESPQPRAAAGGAAHGLAGTRTLVRLALRRDRVLIPVWLAVFVATASSTASSTLALYPDIAARRGIATTINGNPAMLAFYGRVYDIDSAGAVAMFKVNALGAALVAVLTLMLTVRHTRAEEEAGRLELLGAGVLGRFAPLTAALITSAGTAVVLGVLSALSLVGAGLPVAGSFAFGLGWGLVGVCFAAVGAVTAQLTTSARAATGLAGAVLGATYLLRAAGDVADADGPRWLSWFSPVGWAQQVRPFAGDRWWVFGIGLAFAVVVGAAAYVLVLRRDHGAGLFPDRPGPATAGRRLGGPFALALRLQRGVLLAWSGAMLLMGLVVGSLGSSIDAFLDSDQARDMIARLGGTTTMLDAFFGVEQGAAALIVTIFAISSVLRMRAEESGLRAEPLLATAIGRRRWAAGYLAVAALGATWLMLVVGLGMGAAGAATLHDGAWFGRLVGGALAHVPAILVMIGIAVAAFGLVPRFAAAAWAFLVGFLLLGELGPIFELDRRVLDVSPYVHVPGLGHVTAAPLVVLTLVAAALTAVGLEAFRRRDVG